jgi:hypothetical protein
MNIPKSVNITAPAAVKKLSKQAVTITSANSLQSLLSSSSVNITKISSSSKYKK